MGRAIGCGKLNLIFLCKVPTLSSTPPTFKLAVLESIEFALGLFDAGVCARTRVQNTLMGTRERERERRGSTRKNRDVHRVGFDV